MRGPFRFLATHGWYYDLVKDKRYGIVTTSVMTKVSEGSRVLIYSGHLTGFYLNVDGNFSYIVLKDYSRHYLDLATNNLTIPGTRLLPNAQPHIWNHLVIPGDNISNVTFDPIHRVEFKELDEGTKALEARLSEDAAAEAHDLQGG
jgi:hypothetical protein